MTTTKRLSLLSLALVALPVLAQSSESVTGQVEVGFQKGRNLGSNSVIGKYEVAPTGLGLYDMSIRWELPANYWMQFVASDIGTEMQSAALTGGKRHEFKWNLEYDQNPYVTGQDVTTYYTQTSPGVFRLPDALRQQMQATYWVPGGGAITVAASDPRNVALGAALGGYYTIPVTATVPVTNPAVIPYPNGNLFPDTLDLKSTRKTAKAGFEYNGFEKWTLNIDYRNDHRTGNQSTPIYDGTTVTQVAAPIDYRTHNLHASAQYVNGRYFGEFGLDFSKFVDGISALYIDNPMRLTNDPASTASATTPGGLSYRQAQAAVMAMPTAPDNKANGFNFAGGVNLPGHNRLVVSYATTQMSMDTTLMAGSTIPYYVDQTNGYSAITVKMNNTLLTAKLSGEPIRAFGYSLSFRSYELKDKTDDYEFPLRGRGDSSQPTADPHGHADEGWKKDTIKAEVHTTIVKGLRLGVSYANDKATYDERDATTVKDKTLGITADGHYGIVSFHTNYANLKRTPTWKAGFNPDTIGNSSFTDQAERETKMYNGIVTLAPTDSLAVSFIASGIDNKFTDSLLHGLQKSTSENYGVDLSYMITDQLSVNAAYVFENYKYDMISQYLGTDPTKALATDKWSNHSQDDVDTVKVGLRWTCIPGTLDLSSDWDYSKGRGQSAYTVDPSAVNTATHSYQAAGYNSDPNAAVKPYGYTMSNAGPYLVQPVVVKDQTIWKTKLNYHVNKNLTASLMYWVQRMDSADWANDVMKAYMYSLDPGANKSLFLGKRTLGYDSEVYRASISYRF